MSYCRQIGKDKIIFATKEDHQIPSTVTLPEPDPQPGLILSDGTINWSCPCLGGMATGPCGVEFREAFSCFHYSTAEPKGSDCYEQFSAMQSCMAKYPTLYNKLDSEDKDESVMDPLQNIGNAEEEKHPDIKQSTEAKES
ncbi:mitochondrial intermembrane space import and assembly protein 40-B [Anabrus simplex]|uniref:mitochondrial intermembrane space import and assembly protein 40-B n=1 Tax=Anabrus simplex TaxID=316456 RepID=UPI0034DCFC27